jgi:signal transduction histidine kinase
LVVDDESSNLQAVEVALEGLDIELVTVTTAERALREVLRRDFAVAVLDIKLPVSNGFEIAELIRARSTTRHLPIIFLTGRVYDDAYIHRAYDLGAVDYLFKPFVTEVLRAKVQVFVDLHKRTLQAVAQAREIERAREERVQLEAADRHKDEFLAVLAHELRNPLNPVVTGLEIVRSQTRDQPMLVKTCDAMHRQLSHLVRLIDDLLDVSRIARGKIELQREPLDVRSCIEQALEISAGALTAAAHQLTLNLGDVPLVVDADRVRITQVASNLLTNAIRYTPPGGEIRIEAGLEGREVYFRVRDNGIGIDKDAIDRVFDTFVQERTGRGGLGLGLTVVKSVAALHGGSVNVSSDGRGRGSEFEVRLPQSDALQSEAETAAAPNVELQGPLRVLVVDDNDDIRRLSHDLLASWGHEVRVATGGIEALAVIAESRPDVVLLDIGMPDLDGYQVAERVRAEMPNERPMIVAVTGYGRAEDRARAEEAGFDAHIVKPAQPDALREVLQRARASHTAPRGA